MSNPRPPHIAIIGAGMAGLACAQQLQQQGWAPVIFEKSRGIGGRLATRRTDSGDRFDHGAQFVTARSPAFAALLDALQRRGTAARWDPHQGVSGRGHERPWMVGTPGMSALLRPLAAPLDVRTGTSVAALHREADKWSVQIADGTTPGLFDVVVVTAPAAQSQMLLASQPALVEALAEVAMAPCWAAMLRFATPLPMHEDVRRFERGPVAWMARQSSRPGNGGGADQWVIHASASWSREHLDESPEQVLSQLYQALAEQVGVTPPAIEFGQTHRWRYALTTQPLGQPFLASPDGSLYVGGDWCLGARVEYAFQSGQAMAEALLASHG